MVTLAPACFLETLTTAVHTTCPPLHMLTSLSSDQDAVWIARNQELKCDCAGDVFLLFKSSEFITRDLTEAYNACVDKDDCREALPSMEVCMVSSNAAKTV